MDNYPPRAEKKYSQTWEFTLNRISRGFVVRIPNFFKMDDRPISMAPIYGSVLSLVPGLGTFYLTQKIGWPLIQFGICLMLFIYLPFSLGTAWGTFMAMTLFSTHQFIMYRCYLKGLELNGISPPSFWGGMRTSLFMVVGLVLFYYLASIPFSDRFYYARGNLGTVVTEGDRFVVNSSENYQKGEIVVFNRENRYRDSNQGQSAMVERILAKDGDQVAFQDGKILVNGQVLTPEKGPLETGSAFPGSGFEVPQNCYFVLYPVRTNGPITPENFLIKQIDIKGKIALKYSPNWEVLP